MTKNIEITPEAYLKLKYYVLNADDEISGLGISKIIDEQILVTDIFLLEQESAGASTELDEKAISKLIAYLHKTKKIDVATLNVWWHSHADMSVHWSPTDDANIEQFVNSKYLISLVYNKELEYKARLDLYKPFRITIDIDSVTLAIENAELQKKIVKEIAKKVKKPTGVKYGGYRVADEKPWWKEEEEREKKEMKRQIKRIKGIQGNPNITAEKKKKAIDKILESKAFTKPANYFQPAPYGYKYKKVSGEWLLVPTTEEEEKELGKRTLSMFEESALVEEALEEEALKDYRKDSKYDH